MSLELNLVSEVKRVFPQAVTINEVDERVLLKRLFALRSELVPACIGRLLNWFLTDPSSRDLVWDLVQMLNPSISCETFGKINVDSANNYDISQDGVFSKVTTFQARVIAEWLKSVQETFEVPFWREQDLSSALEFWKEWIQTK